MRNYLKLFILLIMVMGIMVLAGCKKSGDIIIDQSFYFDENFSGQRVVTIKISEEAYKNYFESDFDKLNSIINDGPSGMSVTAVSDNNGIDVIMTITFGNYSQYLNSINSVLGIDFQEATGYDPYVYYDNTTNLIKSGVTFKENFSEKDLLRWFYKALVAKEIISEKTDINELFIKGIDSISVEGTSIEREENIDTPLNLSTVDNECMKSIDIKAVVLDDGGYDVQLSIKGKTDSQLSSGSKISSLLRKSISNDTQLTVNQDSDYKTYSVKFKALNEQDFVSRLSSILHNNNAVFTRNKAGDNKDETQLKGKDTFMIYVDGSYFLNYADPETSMSFSLSSDPDYSSESLDTRYGSIINKGYQYTNSHCIMNISLNMPDYITAVFGYSVSIEEIKVVTNVNTMRDVDRQITFRMTKDEYDIIGTRFDERIKSRVEDGITYEMVTDADSAIFNVVLSATSTEELSKLTGAFMEGKAASPNSKLLGGKDKQNSVSKVRYHYTDTLDFSDLLGGSKINSGIVYTINFPKNISASIIGDENYENIATEKNSISCVTYNNSVTIESEGTRINYIGVLLRILWIFSGICTVVIIVMNFATIAAAVKSRSSFISSLNVRTKKQYKRLSIVIFIMTLFVFTSLRLFLKIY